MQYYPNNFYVNKNPENGNSSETVILLFSEIPTKWLFKFLLGDLFTSINRRLTIFKIKNVLK